MNKKFISVSSSINKNSTKLDLDQYYTPYETMKYCVDKTLEILKEYKIDNFLEPSAGEGIFSDYLIEKGYDVIAFDIEPKKDNIIQTDFLTYDIEYKENRCVIGNPPYGARLNTAQKFYKKSVEIADYISFILPISQLWNTNSMYEFDLIYSEDLGKILFSNSKKIHCCLNIYKRPNNELNKKKTEKLKDITIIRQDKKGYDKIGYDIRMCYWGNGSAGKILKENEHYSGEYKIIIHNKELKEDIINLLTTIDFKKELNSTAMLKIQQFHIINILKKYIPNIK